ncbi:oxidoreductase [Streptomyces sp. S-9]|uniref:WD40/YVTN/BNR-like repeat-containing protein n=1 Tax=Streptomyces sp. S-9 TaxID=2806600 RepID=UPI0027DA5840|nr:oxidoreductase [Streptomyces sp. S-9]
MTVAVACAAACAALTAVPAQAHGPQGAEGEQRVPHWVVKDTGAPDVRFRGLAAVSRDTAWVAGTLGTVLRTTDGGRTWRDVSPPGAGELQFRDVEAFDARRAVVLAIGEGEDSRVYRTDDGGTTWTETFRNPDARAFYDCLTFFDPRHGLAMSDPVDGKFRILSTRDGGRSWTVLPDTGMPPALEGEAGFAASGQCLVSSGPRDVWLATGGAARARVLHSADRGRTWTVTATTIPAGDPARGVFALAFRDRHHGLAVGGDFTPGLPSPDAAARTTDGGRTWRPAAGAEPVRLGDRQRQGQGTRPGAVGQGAGQHGRAEVANGSARCPHRSARCSGRCRTSSPAIWRAWRNSPARRPATPAPPPSPSAPPEPT